jgi:hypothetical protein
MNEIESTNGTALTDDTHVVRGKTVRHFWYDGKRLLAIRTKGKAGAEIVLNHAEMATALCDLDH